MNRNRTLIACLCVALAGCSTYKPKSLDAESSLPETIPHLSVEAASMPFPEMASHRFDPSDGLDIVEVAMLAVVNNPDLKIARDDAGIAHAQAFSAGLLPDPQLTWSRDLSNSGGVGTVPAFSMGLNYDVGSLFTHSALHAAADAEAQKIDLNVLWQEWQVVAQSRLLFVKLSQAKKLRLALQQNQSVFEERLRRTTIALDKGLSTSDVVNPNLIALQDVQRQSNDLDRQINQYSHDLNLLLGLAPQTVVPLQGDVMPSELNESELRARVADLPRRRPDLLGLEAGYRAQDQRYRAALLAQFPALNVGFTRGRDNANVYSNAIGITLSLPIFNRNRGNIAIEEATREKLHDEYQQRLNTSRSEIHRLLDEQALNTRQLREVETGIAALSDAAQKSDRAFQVNNIDAMAYANVHAALLSKQIEQINLQQAILEQRVALQALIGGELPLQKIQENGKP